MLHLLSPITVKDDEDDDEYLQYLQYLALQEIPKVENEDLINPFAEQKIIAANIQTDDEWVSDYPQLQKLQEQVYSQEAVSSYRPPADTTMNPVGYPPNRPQPPRLSKEEPISYAPPHEPKGVNSSSSSSSSSIVATVGIVC